MTHAHLPARGTTAARARAAALGLRASADTLARLAVLVDRAAVVLLMLAVAALVFRPADLIGMTDAPIYEGLILACIACSVPRLLERLAAGPIRFDAVSALVLLLVPAVVLSHLAHWNTYDARLGALGMVKGCTLFVLIVGLVDTKARLRALLLAFGAAMLAITILAVMQYHGLVHLAVAMSVEYPAPLGNEAGAVVRLCGIGIFNDPNDFSLALVLAVLCCAFGLGENRLGRMRWAFLAPVLLFGYALLLTHSRGGLVSAVAAVLAYVTARFGLRHSLPLVGILVVLLPAMIPGRQAEFNIDEPEDSFQARMDLWNASLDAFRAEPVLGIGQGKLVDTVGFVAHNSYLHAFAELGLLGGVAFVGAFYVLAQGIRSGRPGDLEVARLRPYVLAMVVSYSAGLLSLSRCYAVTTQLVLGLGTAFLVIAARSGGLPLPRLDLRCLQRITGVALVFLVGTYLFVRVMQQGPS
jgi:O-antigen ligase